MANAVTVLLTRQLDSLCSIHCREHRLPEGLQQILHDGFAGLSSMTSTRAVMASVAMLEKLALLKIALCKAPV
jgi:hypothetical protein